MLPPLFIASLFRDRLRKHTAAAGLCSVALFGCGVTKFEVLVPPEGSAAPISPSASVPTVGSCSLPSVPPCILQLDEPCKADHECCSGACVAGADGTSRCQSVAACKSYCEACSDSSECCSGRCVGDALRIAVCHSGACLAQGEICAKDGDCCAEAGPAHCVEDPKGLKTRRCRLDSSGPPCALEGTRCGRGAECCSGFCVGGGKKELSCAASCVLAGAPCTTTVDCCSSAECRPVGGVNTCIDLIE